MLRKLLFLLLITRICSGELVGDHICAAEESSLVNVTEYFIRNATTREYKWCLNVPPRCSFYTSRQINDSRIVEKNETKLIEKCCPGFVEDIHSNTCVPNCTLCIHGLCSNGSCSCFSGFQGKFCEKECQSNFWGIDCKYECACERGTCEPSTGICNCPAGFTGPRCDKNCPLGFYGRNCTENCNCHQTQICDTISGLCQDLTTAVSTKEVTTVKEVRAVYISKNDKYGNLTLRKIFNPASEKPSLKLYGDFDSDTTSPVFDLSSPLYTNYFSTSTSNEKMSIHSTTEINVILPTERNSKSTILTYKNNGKFSITESNVNNEKEKETNLAVERDRTFHFNLNEEGMKHNSQYISADTDFTVLEEPAGFENESDKGRDPIDGPYNKTSSASTITGGIQKIEKRQPQSGMSLLPKNKRGKHFSNHNSLDTYMSDESKNKSPDYESDTSEDGFLSSISIPTALSITIIVFAFIIAISRHFLNKHKKKVGPGNIQKSDKAPTVSVVTHSIFHTPLPEPPLVKNPLFTAPSEVDGETTTFETKIVCSMNFANNNTDPREYLYDHPPSTGSYRAASIPEPPDIEDSVVSTVSVMPSEPVYDEIPCRNTPSQCDHPFDSSSTLYVNTCGRTRL